MGDLYGGVNLTSLPSVRLDLDVPSDRVNCSADETLNGGDVSEPNTNHRHRRRLYKSINIIISFCLKHLN